MRATALRKVLDTFHGGLLHISPIHLDNLRVSFGEGVGGRPRPLQAAPRRLPSEPDRRGWWLTLTMVGFNTLREFILSICEYRSGKAVAPNRRCRAAWQPPRTLNAIDAPQQGSVSSPTNPSRPRSDAHRITHARTQLARPALAGPESNIAHGKPTPYHLGMKPGDHSGRGL